MSTQLPSQLAEQLAGASTTVTGAAPAGLGGVPPQDDVAPLGSRPTTGTTTGTTMASSTGVQAGCAMAQGGACNCGPGCTCTGCPTHAPGGTAAAQAAPAAQSASSSAAWGSAQQQQQQQRF